MIRASGMLKPINILSQTDRLGLVGNRIRNASVEVVQFGHWRGKIFPLDSCHSQRVAEVHTILRRFL